LSLNLIATGSSAGGGREVAGVVVAVLSAALYDLGYVLEKRALVDLPSVRLHPVALLRSVASSRQWLAGFAAMLGGLCLQLVALTMAPVSVVQPVLAGGLIGLVVIGGAVLEERLQWRQRAALVLVLGAVVAIAVSASAGGQVAERAPAPALFGLALPLTVLGVLASSVAMTGRVKSDQLKLVGAAVGAGAFYGLGAVAEKAVATRLVADGLVHGAVASLATAYPWLFVVATLAGMLIFQVGLQRHPASLMATFTNVISSVCALVGASVVFGELLLPPGWSSLARIVGFAALAAAVIVLAVDSESVHDAAITEKAVTS
jgi:multidrug transporter EmrE-like cation transporter